MATRRETEQQKIEVQEAIRRECGLGALAAQSLLPPSRDLASRYGVSLYVVHRAVQSLIAQGVLYTLPRVGTFVGRAQNGARAQFLLLTDIPVSAIRIGFEEAVAGYGGHVVTFDYHRAVELFHQGALDQINGVLDLAFNPRDGLCWPRDCPAMTAPRVRFSPAEGVGNDPHCDCVSFDDVAGGALATRHLLSRGHQRIAFLALHSEQEKSQPLLWSVEREAGWHATLLEAGQDPRGLAFHPHETPLGWEGELHRRLSAQTAQRLLPEFLGEAPITAVVAANDAAALGLLDALGKSDIPARHWPALVGFDNDPIASERLLTSLHLPHEEVGRQAAALLWERLQGCLSEHCVHRRLPMRLLPRLTCQPQWSGHAQNLRWAVNAPA